MIVDTTHDFRTDSGGRDPDSHSPTLRRYHQVLWSKPLPDGALFDLDTTTPYTYLHHRSALGEFWLSSDSVLATFVGRRATAAITSQFTDEENEGFNTVGYTIGGMMLFPSNRVGGKQTLNGARGFHPRIADRMDLTLECIRRHYLGQASPLGVTLARHSDFFGLFGDFSGYLDFFLLQDLVTGDGSSVRFFMPFFDFKTPAVPKDLPTYVEFRRLSIEFVEARNRRINDWVDNRSV